MNFKWQKLTRNFSNVECELLDKKSKTNDDDLKNSNLKSSNLLYSWVIDRNQIIKNSFSIKSSPPPMSNLSLYYELFKVMPELSEMNIR